MRTGVRWSVATLALTMVAIMPLTAMAEDGSRDRVETDRVSDQPIDVADDRVADKVVDKARDRVDDNERDVRPVTDVRPDRQIDREADRVTDRCHPRIVDNVRRCLHDDRPHDFNIRHLIWRLIKAHEWEKLIRLLHWLGWV